MYRGIIIAECLTDTRALKRLNITEMKIKKVTAEHQTPWLKQWTLYTVEIPESKANKIAALLSQAIDYKHASSWYIDFKNKNKHYIIFKDKIFFINRSEEEYKKVREYGISLGIPSYQLDFSLEDR